MKKLLLLLIIAIPFLSISCNEDDDKPESLLTIVQGTDVVNGLYRYVFTMENQSDTNDYVFSGTNSFSLSVYDGEYSSTDIGTWERNELVLSLNMEESVLKGKSLFFNKDGIDYFIFSAFEKISGDKDEVIGDYESSTVYYFIEDDVEESSTGLLKILNDGTYQIILTEDNLIFQSGTWTMDEVKNGDIFFVDYLDKRFVVIPSIQSFIKQ